MLKPYSLTGESESLRKAVAPQGEKLEDDLFGLPNIVFMGTAVISGSGLALVMRTSDGTYNETNQFYRCSRLTQVDVFIATIMKQLNKKRPLNSFQRGIRNVTYMMIVFMLIMVPIVSIADVLCQMCSNMPRFWPSVVR